MKSFKRSLQEAKLISFRQNLRLSLLHSCEELQAKLSRKVSGEANISFRQNLRLVLLQSYEELQAKLSWEVLSETNILALQQDYRASSETILLGHA